MTTITFGLGTQSDTVAAQPMPIRESGSILSLLADQPPQVVSAVTPQAAQTAQAAATQITLTFQQEIIDGNVVYVIKENGFIHAVSLCKTFGKQFNRTKTSPKYIAYITELCKMTGQTQQQLSLSFNDFTNTAQNGDYVHPLIALYLASLSSPEIHARIIILTVRYLQGDLSLITEIVNKYDHHHGTSSTFNVITGLADSLHVQPRHIMIDETVDTAKLILEYNQLLHRFDAMEGIQVKLIEQHNRNIEQENIAIENRRHIAYLEARCATLEEEQACQLVNIKKLMGEARVTTTELHRLIALQKKYCKQLRIMLVNSDDSSYDIKDTINYLNDYIFKISVIKEKVKGDGTEQSTKSRLIKILYYDTKEQLDKLFIAIDEYKYAVKVGPNKQKYYKISLDVLETTFNNIICELDEPFVDEYFRMQSSMSGVPKYPHTQDLRPLQHSFIVTPWQDMVDPEDIPKDVSEGTREITPKEFLFAFVRTQVRKTALQYELEPYQIKWVVDRAEQELAHTITEHTTINPIPLREMTMSEADKYSFKVISKIKNQYCTNPQLIPNAQADTETFIPPQIAPEQRPEFIRHITPQQYNNNKRTSAFAIDRYGNLAPETIELAERRWAELLAEVVNNRYELNLNNYYRSYIGGLLGKPANIIYGTPTRKSDTYSEDD
jgi:hypothetical protein